MFTNTVIAERRARRILRCGHRHRMTMHPDGPAVQEVLRPPLETLDQLPRAFHRVASQVDRCLGIEGSHPLPKVAGGLLRLAVQMDIFDLRPGDVIAIRALFPTAYTKNGVAGFK